MEKVTVSKGLLIGLGASSITLLTALGFFIGRESAHRSGPATLLAATPGTATQAPLAAPSKAASTDIPAGPGAPVQAVPTFTQEARPAPGTPVDPMRESVAAYLAAIDRIQPEQSGDPSDLANKVVEALGKGDTSGLDNLIRQFESAHSRLESLGTPAPCVAHHRASLASLEEGLVMLRSVKKAVAASDASGLTALDVQASGLRSRAGALEAEEKSLRQRYSLTR